MPWCLAGKVWDFLQCKSLDCGGNGGPGGNKAPEEHANRPELRSNPKPWWCETAGDGLVYRDFLLA